MSAIVIAKVSANTVSGVAGVGLMCLTQGIKELNMAYDKQQELIDCDQESHQVDILIKTLDGKEIGVIEQNNEFHFIAPDPNCASTLDAIKQVKQRYSKHLMLTQLKQKGYDKVKEEKLPDGSIRMVVEKWE